MPQNNTKHDKPRVRDAEATKKRILLAAKKEFSKLGQSGARIDVIAERSKANKRMIYHYFGSKDELFRTVLEQAYGDIRAAEKKLDLEAMEPEEAIETLVTFTWKYYLKNPEFLSLVNAENLQKGKNLKRSETISATQRPLIDMVGGVLKRGVKKGVFRKDIDVVQFNITIAAISYYYLTNRHTGSIIYKRDLMSDKMLKDRLAFNLDTIKRLLKKP